MERDRHSQMVRGQRRSPRYRRAYLRNLHKIDVALLVREMREAACLSQQELAERVGTTQSVIARLEDAAYTSQSLKTLVRIAAACGIGLRLQAVKGGRFNREVVLV